MTAPTTTVQKDHIMADSETKEQTIARVKKELFEMTATVDITPEMRDEYLQKEALLDSLISE